MIKTTHSIDHGIVYNTEQSGLEPTHDECKAIFQIYVSLSQIETQKTSAWDKVRVNIIGSLWSFYISVHQHFKYELGSFDAMDKKENWASHHDRS